MDLLALSIPITVFLSQFSMIALCTCYIIIASIWNAKPEMSEGKSEIYCDYGIFSIFKHFISDSRSR